MSYLLGPSKAIFLAFLYDIGDMRATYIQGGNCSVNLGFWDEYSYIRVLPDYCNFSF